MRDALILKGGERMDRIMEALARAIGLAWQDIAWLVQVCAIFGACALLGAVL